MVKIPDWRHRRGAFNLHRSQSCDTLAQMTISSCPLDQVIALQTLAVALPNCFVFLPPIAHQVGAHMDIRSAFIACNKMAPADIEEPRLMAMTAFDISETLTENKIAQAFL